MTDVSYTSVLRALCRSITTNRALRVNGRQEGYRCKATYSLLPELHVSPLSMTRVNEIAIAVADFCKTRSAIVDLAPDFFSEVCVKVNCVGQYMVKLSLLNRGLHSTSSSASAPQKPPAGSASLNRTAVTSHVPVSASPGTSEATTQTLFDVWRSSSEPYALEDHLRNLYPGLTALVAHVCQPTDSLLDESLAKSELLHRKPDKSSAYLPCTRDGATAMVEYTPNGHAFWLSADSFCEVNHAMEDAIYVAIVAFLRLAPSADAKDDGAMRARTETITGRLLAERQLSKETAPGSSPPPVRRVFISGRDVNSVVRTFEEYYSDTTVVTTCPCVYADTKRNNITHCIHSSKDRICEPLRAFARSPRVRADSEETRTYPNGSDKVEIPSGFSEAPSRASAKLPEELHVLITAGRHGLHPSTTTTLSELGAAARLSDLIYVSCNVESLTRDVHVLKESWYIANARTFDFFPGTDYVMTVLHFRPFSARTPTAQLAGRGGGRGDLLVLPVGLPGVGKSTSGRALGAFFQGAQATEGSGAHLSNAARATPPSRKRANRGNGAVAAPACVVPRTLLPLKEHAVRYRHVERDQLFHDARNGASLKLAKQRTHEALVTALGKWGRETVQKDSETLYRTPRGFSRRVLYLDSTNGSAAARALYASLWQASSQPTPGESDDSKGCMEDVPLPATCLVLFFEPPESRDELFCRVRQRGPHPSFPVDAEEIQRKLDNIAAALKADGDIEEDESALYAKPDNGVDGGSGVFPVVSWHLHASASTNGTAETIQEVVLTVCAHLLFSSELAVLLRDDALQKLREAT